MQIRTRVSILSVLMTVIAGAVIVFAAIQRESLIGERFANQIIADQLILWNKIKDGLIDDMENVAWVVTQNRPLIEALDAEDMVEVQRIGSQIKSQFSMDPTVDRVDIILPDGTLAFSSQSGIFQSAIVSNAVVEQILEIDEPIRGVGNDKQRNTALVFGTPIHADDGTTLGLGVLSLDIVHALAELEEVNFSSVVIVNRRGRLLASTGDNLWDRYSELIEIAEANNLQTIEDDGRYFSVIVLPQTAELGGLVGRLLNIREVTRLVQQQQQISRNTTIAILIFLAIAIVGIYLYLTHSFTPLTEGVSVLSALSKGDLRAQIERSTGNDEVGLIANSVNVFRSNLLTLSRVRRSRERQHGRQQRFIFREMKGLADTLDGEEREELLEELRGLGELVERKDDQRSKQRIRDLTADSTESDGQQDSDSLSMLAIAFQGMSSRVQDQHQRLRDALATKETLIALRNELSIATRVQQSLVPDNVDISSNYKIWGGMWPAKEVGGDFYDFFPLDDHRLAIAIADVSGKGVPAALFTVMSRTMLHATAAFLNSPGKALSVINNFLESNNNEGLFVTVFYCILDLRTGKLKYANGGHNPPVLLDSKGVRPLEPTAGMVLAMFRNIQYKDREIDLEPGARLVMFTDGIPEAFNAEDEAFGDERLLQTIETLPDQGPEDDVRTIVQEVNDFVQEAPQFDDIACVVLRFKEYMDSQNLDGIENMNENSVTGVAPDESATLALDIDNDLSELARIANEIEAHGTAHKWPNEWIFNVNLSLDELVTNVINYGYREGTDSKDIELTLKVVDDNLIVELVDDGIEFDPFNEAPEPDIDSSLEERRIGGLGIFFVKSLVSETRYHRKDGKNYTILVLHPPA